MHDIRARSFVLIIVVIALLVLVLRITIERVIKTGLAQNESNASATLKLISVALQNYAKDNHDTFPSGISLLVKTNPQYLDKDYEDKSPIKGYIYSCPRLEPAGYSCSAVPLKCNLTGKMSYTISTGGLLVSEECTKRD